jgi:hypothetical protein
MRKSVGLRALVGVCAAVTAVFALGVGTASAQNFFHGIAFTKGCESPANVNSAYLCSYQILNVADTAHDTLTVNGLSDQVHSFGGDVNSGNILGALQLIFSGPTVTCVGGTGAGTMASPYTGATSCQLPFGTSITTNDHSFYTVQAADLGLALHQLTDTASLNWADNCDVGPQPPTGNCTTAAQVATAGSSATVQNPDANIQITPPSATNHVGDTHTLTGHVNVSTDGTTFANAPDGTTINFTKDSGPGTLNASSCVTSGGTGSCTVTLTSSQTGTTVVSAHTDVVVAGTPLHRDTNGVGANSNPAQKLWVNAAITIAPNATNEVGAPHTFTATLLFDTGAGLVPAGANQPVTVTLTGANGANPTPAGPFNLTTNANGQVAVTFTSATPGAVTGHATWTGTISGSAPITVSTNGVAPNSADAVKTFVDAYIEISPPVASNPLNVTHTYTAHVFVNNGSGAAYANAPDGTVVTFTLLPGSVGHFLAGNTCTTAGGTGTCTIDTTSSVAGDDTMQASTTLAVGGVTLTRTTGQPAPGHANSGNAVKHWIPPTPGGIIAPTQTTCQDFTGGVAATLGQVNYSVSKGVIGQGINPGVFFFYTKITTTQANQVVTVTETNTSTNNTPNFGILNGQAWLYPANCSSHTVGATSGPNGENASFTVPLPGNYIIGIKYQTKTIAGAPAPVPANITFNFATSLGGGTGASVDLKKQ